MLLLVALVSGCSQSSNAVLGGTVSDAAGALIPGVTVTATNVATGIAVTTISNEAGDYNFPSLFRHQRASELPVRIAEG